MARYIGPKCRLCRREGVQLFLKGTRCESPKCALIRRQTPPGQHGISRRSLSDYGVQLREKQKTKRIYGVLEAQFRHYYAEASRHGGETGATLLQLLERRLDNTIYRLHMAASRAHARQLIRQGKISVNGKKVTIPSLRVNKGDSLVFSGVPGDSTSQVPVWLHWDGAKKTAKILDVPAREDINEQIEEHLIVEFYSR